MRRILASLPVLLLALLVVGAQQAALVHEIGHGFGHGQGPVGVVSLAAPLAASGARDASPGSTERGSYCDKCFAFAHVQGALFASTATIAALPVCGLAVPCGQAADLRADTPQVRSRGPPTVL